MERLDVLTIKVEVETNKHSYCFVYTDPTAAVSALRAYQGATDLPTALRELEFYEDPTD